MFYLEGDKQKPLSGSCDKTQKPKRMFLSSFGTFHWLHLNVILRTKPHYAFHGEERAIWPVSFRLFIAVYF